MQPKYQRMVAIRHDLTCHSHALQRPSKLLRRTSSLCNRVKLVRMLFGEAMCSANDPDTSVEKLMVS